MELAAIRKQASTAGATSLAVSFPDEDLDENPFTAAAGNYEFTVLCFVEDPGTVVAPSDGLGTWATLVDESLFFGMPLWVLVFARVLTGSGASSRTFTWDNSVQALAICNVADENDNAGAVSVSTASGVIGVGDFTQHTVLNKKVQVATTEAFDDAQLYIECINGDDSDGYSNFAGFSTGVHPGDSAGGLARSNNFYLGIRFIPSGENAQAYSTTFWYQESA